MLLTLFNFGEYAIFIWPAFVFTFIIFFSLYLNTKKELQKIEKIYLNNFSNKYSKFKGTKTVINKHVKDLIGTLTS